MQCRGYHGVDRSRFVRSSLRVWVVLSGRAILVLAMICCFSGCVTFSDLFDYQGYTFGRLADLNGVPASCTQADEDEGRFPATHAGATSYEHRSFLGRRRNDFDCTGFTLPEVIAKLADLPPELVFGWSALPGGRYEIHVTSRGDESTKDSVFRAIESAYGVKMTSVNKEVDVWVLRKAPNWNEVGFKQCHNRAMLRHADREEPQGHHAEVDVRCENVSVLEVVRCCTDHIHTRPLLVNETGITSAVDAEVIVSQDAGFFGVQQTLADHGLLLTAEKRVMQTLLIEKDANARMINDGD
jgi:hypothetical protein